MPSTTDPYSTPVFGGGLQFQAQRRPASYQMYGPASQGSAVAPRAYADDELNPAYGQPQPMQAYAPVQPSGAQVPASGGSYVAPGGGLLTPPPQPGYQTGQTAAIGTPIPGSETGLGAIGNDGRSANETSTAGMQNLIRDQILNLIAQPAPTANDPQIAGQTSAYNAAQNRASARQINQNAEAFGASGLESSGARLSADRGVIEQQGLNEGLFASQAMRDELTARRDQIQRALMLGAATMDQDLSRRLQNELATLNATIQRESLAQTNTLATKDLDLRGRLGQGNLNLGLLSLLENGRQFNNGLGFNIANAEAMLNNNAIRTLLGY
jgi:hypothetical protein